jgi:uncharacterized protein
MPLFSVNANDIDTAGVAIDAALPVTWLDAELADAGFTAKVPGHLTARLSRTGEEIVVRGKATADIIAPCARCLDPTLTSVVGELSLLLKPARVVHDKSKDAKSKNGKAGASGVTGVTGVTAATAEKSGEKASKGGHAQKHEKHADKHGKHDTRDEEYEFSSDEADADHYDGETVVLDPFVREALLLEVPNFPLCSEACPGIRPAAAEEPSAPPVDPRLSPLAALRDRLPSKPASKSTGVAAEAAPKTAAKTSKKQKKKE